MGFRNDGTAQGMLVASTWADLQAQLPTPSSPADLTAAINAHCAALNGLAYTWDQQMATTVQHDSGGTDKPKTLAY